MGVGNPFFLLTCLLWLWPESSSWLYPASFGSLLVAPANTSLRLSCFCLPFWIAVASWTPLQFLGCVTCTQISLFIISLENKYAVSQRTCSRWLCRWGGAQITSLVKLRFFYGLTLLAGVTLRAFSWWLWPLPPYGITIPCGNSGIGCQVLMVRYSYLKLLWFRTCWF